MAAQLKSKYRRRLVKECLARLPRRLENATVAGAAKILAALGHENELFWWLGVQDGIRHSWTAKRLEHAATPDNDMSSWTAADVKIIEFFGGPPNRLKIHTGSLLTLLLDRIILNIEHGGAGGGSR